MTLNHRNHINHFGAMSNKGVGRCSQEDEFTLDESYRVWRGIYKCEDGSTMTHFGVQKLDEEDKYLPKIYYKNKFEGGPVFQMQSLSFGDIGAEEAEKMIAGYQVAIEAVNILNMNFC